MIVVDKVDKTHLYESILTCGTLFKTIYKVSLMPQQVFGLWPLVEMARWRVQCLSTRLDTKKMIHVKFQFVLYKTSGVLFIYICNYFSRGISANSPQRLHTNEGIAMSCHCICLNWRSDKVYVGSAFGLLLGILLFKSWSNCQFKKSDCFKVLIASINSLVFPGTKLHLAE